MAALSVGLALVGVATALYAYAGFYGFNVVLRRGGTLWTSIEADDQRLSPPMRLALQDPAPQAKAGPYAWQEIKPGFEVAEMPVVAGGIEIDRLLLARVDPRHFRFVVRTSPAGNKELGDWMSELGAALVINGSYFSQHGVPDTPIVSAGISMGPSHYEASHGAFVSSKTWTGIRDLADGDWRSALRDQDHAMVSYPLLLDEQGGARAKSGRRWLANRSFVGQDATGRIILGTTREAFFSLDRFAQFLAGADLGLSMALNLDGGPLACQGIALGSYRRDFCGTWEMAADGNDLRLLTPVFGSRRWGLPIVLAVLPR